MDRIGQKCLIEALLFISGDPITISELKKITDLTDDDIKSSLKALIKEYRGKKSGIQIVEIANGYQMVSNSEYSEWIKRLNSSNVSSTLSIPALETLSIVVYNQPVTKVEIEEIRNVNSDGTIKTLLDKRLIKIVGRKEAPGKPFIYGTTREFLQHFGLKDLSELPTLKEFTKEE